MEQNLQESIFAPIANQTWAISKSEYEEKIKEAKRVMRVYTQLSGLGYHLIDFKGKQFIFSKSVPLCVRCGHNLVEVKKGDCFFSIWLLNPLQESGCH
ncbi:MAG: hypothetical protein LBQ31_03975 [Bacteroidales bacterium]|jgi:hypothetical protein|nr:hypothetical protein [Bacteroidales bacterium]